MNDNLNEKSIQNALGSLANQNTVWWLTSAQFDYHAVLWLTKLPSVPERKTNGRDF